MIKSAKIIHKISWRNAIGEYKTRGNRKYPYKFRNGFARRFFCITKKNLLPN